MVRPKMAAATCSYVEPAHRRPTVAVEVSAGAGLGLRRRTPVTPRRTSVFRQRAYRPGTSAGRTETGAEAFSTAEAVLAPVCVAQEASASAGRPTRVIRMEALRALRQRALLWATRAAQRRTDAEACSSAAIALLRRPAAPVDSASVGCPPVSPPTAAGCLFALRRTALRSASRVARRPMAAGDCSSAGRAPLLKRAGLEGSTSADCRPA